MKFIAQTLKSLNQLNDQTQEHSKQGKYRINRKKKRREKVEKNTVLEEKREQS